VVDGDLGTRARTKIAVGKMSRDLDITVKLPEITAGKIQEYTPREAERASYARRAPG